jgi:hypothetical protein
MKRGWSVTRTVVLPAVHPVQLGWRRAKTFQPSETALRLTEREPLWLRSSTFNGPDRVASKYNRALSILSRAARLFWRSATVVSHVSKRPLASCVKAKFWIFLAKMLPGQSQEH